jgi:protein-tyrosine phosphatase
VPTGALRISLARDGVFNARDLGGLPAGDGRWVRPHVVVRADALHRCGPESARGLHDHGVRRVVDLRDAAERDHEGVFDGPGIEVRHVPVLDPAYRWEDDAMAPGEVLTHRYAEILAAFAPRFAEALADVASAPGGVAYHCAVGKDRTGLLTALLLGALGTPREVIVADYARSARVVALQVNWLWIRQLPEGQVSEVEMAEGVWSARPATMAATLDRLDREHGGVTGYLRDAGLGDDVVDELRSRLTTDDPPTE